ncbi:MAG: hypothetical protein VB140_01910 [Burkholderia sp.]
MRKDIHKTGKPKTRCVPSAHISCVCLCAFSWQKMSIYSGF